MTLDKCPQTEQLADYALGKLPDGVAMDVEHHLESCNACVTKMQRSEAGSDAFTDRLRTSGTALYSPFLSEHSLQSVIEVLARLPLEPDVLPEVHPEPLSYSEIATGVKQGEMLGQYRLIRVIGRGGMGVVYKARQARLEKTVAIKILSSSRIDDPQMQSRFRREMIAAGKIEHPNVVRAIYSDEANGVSYLVMEFVDGVTLSALLKTHGPLSVDVACELIRMAAIGLQQVHLAGMVHRDVKPGNLMLSRSGHVKVMDLGLALLNEQQSDGSDDLTLTGQLMGTVDYMAPEQADDTHGVDARADIYGLGATLFALLTGRSPLGSRQQTLLKKLSVLATQSIPALTELRPDAPADLSDVVGRMLARDPDQRFSTVQEVIDALTPFSSKHGLVALLSESCFLNDASSKASLEDAEQNTVILHRGSRDSLQTDRRFEPTVSGPSAETGRSSNRTFRFAFGSLILTVLLLTGGFIWTHLKKDESTTAQQGVASTVIADQQTPVAEIASSETPEVKSPLHDLSIQLEGHDPNDISESIWEVFSSQVAPDVRSTAIHLACLELPVKAILHQLKRTGKPSVRAGLLLALSEYEKESVFHASNELDPGAGKLLESLYFAYLNDPDPEVHASLEFLLRSWQQNEMLEKLRPITEQKLIPFDGGWYQPLHVSAMVVVPGPTDAQLGSPVDEPGRVATLDQNEDIRAVHIKHTFAICSTEVTRYQYWRAGSRYWESSSPDDPHSPVNAIAWRSAVEFCNRLNELEGIPPAENCYYAVEGSNGAIWRQKEDALQLTGYRLPTDEEWEIACRAGTSTIRPFGEESRWFDKYIRGEQSAGERLDVGSLKPNPLGLFDMLGNIAEWVHSDTVSRESEERIRRARGGSAWTAAAGLRSAARYYFEKTSPRVGFRVARTLIRKPYKDLSALPLGNELEIEIGPPSCPDELAIFTDKSFQPLRDQQIVSLGNWNVAHVPTRRFRIRNPTESNIEFLKLPWMSNLFEFSPEPSMVIEPGGTSEFGIRMAAVGVGERFHDLHFQWGKPVSSDAYEFGIPSIRLHGCLEGPLLQIMEVGTFSGPANLLQMGTVPVGSDAGKTLYVINIGNKPIEAEIVEVPAPFAVSAPLDGMIVPHTIEKSFRVKLDTTIPGSYTGQIKVRSKGEHSVDFSFPVQAVVSDLSRFSSIGVYRKGRWLLDHNRDGEAEEEIQFGSPEDRPLTGDWNGDGLCDVAVWRVNSDGRIHVQLQLRGEGTTPLTESEIWMPEIASRPVAADRDGDGRTDLGYTLLLPERNNMIWRFDTAHDGQFSDRIAFGQPLDEPVIGDWNGDGVDDIAVSRPGNLVAPGVRVWQLTWNGLADPQELIYLNPLDVPVAGDWDADGDDDPGGWRPVPHPGHCLWQFETDGDGHSNTDFEGSNLETDIPVVLRVTRRK